MGIDSNHDTTRECLHDFQERARRFVVIEAPGSQAVGSHDKAQKRLAEGDAPGAHGADVAGTRQRRAVGMRVQEADDVAPFLLALQGPGTVEVDAGALTGDTPGAAAKPNAAAMFTEQHPALFDDRLQRRGCTCQYCSSAMPWLSWPTRTKPPCASRITPTRLCRSNFWSSPLRQMPATCTARSFLAMAETCRWPSTS